MDEYLYISEALRLRPVRIERDVELALPWYQDAEVLKGTAALGRETPYDRETVESMFRHLEETGECFIIEIRDDHAWIPIGDVTLSEKDIPIVIGRRDHWGKGIARSVLRYLLRRAREKGFGKIGPIEVYRFNERSLALYRSVGFEKVSETSESLFFDIEVMNEIR